MPFATGSSSTLDSFIASLLAFAVANAGFTAQPTVQSSAGSGSINIRTVSKGSVYWSMHASTSYITSVSGAVGIRAHMAYGNPTAGVNVTSTSLTPAQLNSTAQSKFTVMSSCGYNGAYSSHWLFTDGTCVHGVLLLTTGLYAHISFGTVTKQGSWVGGEYVSGSCASTPSPNWYNWDRETSSPDRNFAIFNGQTALNVAYDGCTRVRMANTGTSSDFWDCGKSGYSSSSAVNTLHMSVSSLANASNSTASHPMAALMSYAPSTSTWRSPMLPIVLLRATDTPEAGFAVVGRVPRVTFLRMTDDMPNASLIHTDWRVFPLFSRITDATSTVMPGSGNYAVAYREI